MGAPRIDPTRLNNAIAFYVTGQPMTKTCAKFGISKTAISSELKFRGIVPHGNRVFLPESRIVADFKRGDSVNALAAQHSATRPAINRVLTKHGVEKRNRSEGMYARMAQASTEERLALSVAAHVAATGRNPSEAEMLLRAQTRERKGWTERTSLRERQLHAWLKEFGHDATVEKAIGRYNVDFALPPVAVELLGGGWHLQRRAWHKQRGKQIIDAGWSLIFVWSDAKNVISRNAALEIVAIAEEARRNPSTIGEYWVVRGDGEILATGRPDDDEWAFVPSARANLHARPRHDS